MKKHSKGNLLITFIVIVSLSALVLLFIQVIVVRLRDSSSRLSEARAFYAADAGLNKAIWYLAGNAGYDQNSSLHIQETFGSGTYYITVVNASDTAEALIVSTGEVAGVERTVSQVVSKGAGVPSVFTEYGVYSGGGENFTGNILISGEVYVSGNTTFGSNCQVINGEVEHPTGTTVTGAHVTSEVVPAVPMPTFDSSSYDTMISYAQLNGISDLTISGNNNYLLNGQTIYVKGNVSISGNTTIKGGGTIVATGTISQSGNTTTSGGSVSFISNGQIAISGNTNAPGANFYSTSNINVSGNTRVQVGSVLTKGPVSLTGNTNISGLIYAGGGASIVSGNPVITGSIVAHDFSSFSGNANVFHDISVFSSTITGFSSSGALTPKKGTWKGI
jgi:formylmethanofuran dehydrogenase subunit C